MALIIVFPPVFLGLVAEKAIYESRDRVCTLANSVINFVAKFRGLGNQQPLPKAMEISHHLCLFVLQQRTKLVFHVRRPLDVLFHLLFFWETAISATQNEYSCVFARSSAGLQAYLPGKGEPRINKCGPWRGAGHCTPVL